MTEKQSAIADETTDPATTLALPRSYSRRTADIDFSAPVADNGYLWWYMDAISDDGRESMTLIVFVGSVFSPYYAAARRRGKQPAAQHCAFNTILYGPGRRKRWSMTERSDRQLERSAHSYKLGPSSLSWDGSSMLARIDERSVPLPHRMRGSIRLEPAKLTEHRLQLDPQGKHFWDPLAPIARVEVDFPSLGVKWRGDGYMDSNRGDEALAEGFSDWDWARARLASGDCAVRYETRYPAHDPMQLALRFNSDGGIVSEPLRDSGPLPSTRVWRVRRRMPGAELAQNGKPTLLRTLEDTPFYARSMIQCEFNGEPGIGFHESLDMRRFEKRWVQTLLPFRMPRFA